MGDRDRQEACHASVVRAGRGRSARWSDTLSFETDRVVERAQAVQELVAFGRYADLDRVVAFEAAVDPDSQPQRFPDRASRLAFYINAYNALAMYGIVQTGVPESLGGLTKGCGRSADEEDEARVGVRGHRQSRDDGLNP